MLNQLLPVPKLTAQDLAPYVRHLAGCPAHPQWRQVPHRLFPVGACACSLENTMARAARAEA